MALILLANEARVGDYILSAVENETLLRYWATEKAPTGYRRGGGERNNLIIGAEGERETGR